MAAPLPEWLEINFVKSQSAKTAQNRPDVEQAFSLSRSQAENLVGAAHDLNQVLTLNGENGLEVRVDNKDVAEHGPENVARDVADGLRGAYLGIQQGTIQVIFATGATAPKLLGTVGDAPADVMRLINALQRATAEARRLRESIHTDRLQGKELVDAKAQIALCARKIIEADLNAKR